METSVVPYNEFTAFIMKFEKEGSPSICGGSLVSPNAILTVAHCVDEADEEDIHIILGQGFYPVATAMKIASGGIHIHPEYNPNKNRNGYDLAIVILNNKVPDKFRPISFLPKEANILDETCFIGGYGDMRNFDLFSTKLMMVAANIYQVKERTYASMTFSSSVGTCVGDSGSPSLVRHNDQFYLSGVVFGAVVFKQTDICSRETIITNISYGRKWIELLIRCK